MNISAITLRNKHQQRISPFTSIPLRRSEGASLVFLLITESLLMIMKMSSVILLLEITVRDMKSKYPVKATWCQKSRSSRGQEGFQEAVQQAAGEIDTAPKKQASKTASARWTALKRQPWERHKRSWRKIALQTSCQEKTLHRGYTLRLDARSWGYAGTWTQKNAFHVQYGK